MKVYFAPRSRAVRTVWLLEEIGLQYELERFTLGQKEMRGPDYTRINPNGRVPTLIDGDITITESTAIAQYLGAKYAPSLVPGPDAANFAPYLQWLQYAEGMIMPPVNNYVVETVLLPPERRNPELAARAMKLINKALAAAEAHMEGRAYLADDFTVADTVTGHAVIVTRRFGADFSALPNLSAYADRLEARPAYKVAAAT
ncbi:glutathione S-transferase family protein [Oceanibacterium hippocampi]|uniref:Glutathione S-transferase GST-6.0 n=1 Tax=Oceanibacterium hippocampi TaxID=745714 RepID=A0A1Y5SR33_9PROT|nr:glutathione S-transferase family protein [Oceanibacterium hippocampi]SLN46472.1 Glutathione S-transferase GST-6.0 [Oceanibacterium hippocampi]